MPSFHKNLSEEQLKEFKEIFDLVDSDGSGDITREELQLLFETLGLRCTDEQLDEMMGYSVGDGKENITFPEFVSVMSQKSQIDFSAPQLKVAFKSFESEGTTPGWIKRDVIEHALVNYGIQKMTLDQAIKLLDIFDPDNTGKINYMEYIHMIESWNL